MSFKISALVNFSLFNDKTWTLQFIKLNSISADAKHL